MRVLVLGASGMLGHTVFRYFSEMTEIETFGTLRSHQALRFFDESLHQRLITAVDVENMDSLAAVLAKVKPTVVINCVGLVKQLAEANNPLLALPINALLPHRLAQLCELLNARLVHISTDCVFSGRRGFYSEQDESDATDLYGRSKFLGEVVKSPHITLRTSIIGHELNSQQGLLEWFLAQQGSVNGYDKAIFSGVPTVELARVIAEFVLPNGLSGLYQVASKPISKFELLRLFAKEYGCCIEILPNSELVLDRSLNGEKFVKVTGYQCPDWVSLIRTMREFNHV
ncbi:dTDP-4-dehydrorhamnose reductase [uncultured bacterium]|nr:dTDP-4-dehydrorhamnose reductase [uncultured bacterium]